MVAEKNVIKKLAVEIDTNSMAMALQLKDSISSFLEREIYPELERYFNSLTSKKNIETIRLNQLSIVIDIEEKDIYNNFKYLLLRKLKDTIKVKLQYKNTVSKDDLTIISSERNKEKALLHFISKGSYPWWFNEEFVFTDDVFFELLSKKDFIQNLKKILRYETARKRLIFQFENSVLQQVALMVSSIEIATKNQLKMFPKSLLNRDEEIVYWGAILEYVVIVQPKKLATKITKILAHKTSKKRILKLLDYTLQIVGHSSNIDFEVFKRNSELERNEIASAALKEEKTLIDPIPKKIEQQSIESHGLLSEEQNEKVLMEGVLVKNAGLIIINPFLKPFFEKLGFLYTSSEQGKLKILSEKVHEAVHVLHYLACKQEQAYEHQLLFEKYICDLPLDFPIDRQIRITDAQKEACNELLRAVLGHWTALKSNSVDVLRSEFFVREGKLTVSEDRHKLFIQRKTQDLLLEKIPWSIGFIKIPWKKKILFTEW